LDGLLAAVFLLVILLLLVEVVVVEHKMATGHLAVEVLAAIKLAHPF
jgi:hypothetical protein